MAMGKEIMGLCRTIERSSFVSSTKVFLNHGNNNMFLVKPLKKRRVLVPLRKVVKHPVVAAVSEDLVKAVPIVSVPAEKFKVRAVVTVKNKNKEEFKDKIAKHLDAFTDKIGRNIVLQLVSSEIDPRKPISVFLLLGVSDNIFISSFATPQKKKRPLNFFHLQFICSIISVFYL